MRKIIVCSLCIFMSIIIMPAKSIENSINDSQISYNESGSTVNGCWIYLETNNRNGFTGSYMHYHIYNESSLAKLPHILDSVLNASGKIAHGLGSNTVDIFNGANELISLVNTYAKNKDGSYDFYILKAKNDSQYSFFGIISEDSNIPIGIKLNQEEGFDAADIIRLMEPSGNDPCLPRKIQTRSSEPFGNESK